MTIDKIKQVLEALSPVASIAKARAITPKELGRIALAKAKQQKLPMSQADERQLDFEAQRWYLSL